VPQLFGHGLGAKPSWDELRERLDVELADRWPATRWEIADETVTWTDGPAESSVVEAVLDIPGWQPIVEGRPPPDTKASSTLVLSRLFGDRALAVGVVRYRSSSTRPFDSAREGAVDRLRDILDVDDPGTSGYPLTDAMAELLLVLPWPGEPPEVPSPADRWALKLEALDFNALWNRAYAEVEL